MKKTYLLIILCIILSTGASATTVCYQESANTTNQTSIDGGCGLNYTGSYQSGGNWMPSNLAFPYSIDGSWTTKGIVNTTPSTTTSDINMTYVKPPNALSTKRKKEEN